MKSFGRYLFTFIFFVSNFFSGDILFAQSNFQAGDLIKASGNPAVYYYGYDGKRHAFPNEQTYFSWYIDFKRVKTISSTILGSLPLGKNIVIRPGTYLVKFHNSPKIYAVEPLGRLRQLLNPTLATQLFGTSWGHKVVYLPEHLFSDYTIAELLAEKKHPTGTIFRYKGEPAYYLMTNNYSRKLVSVAKWENYRFNDYFVQTIDKSTLNYVSGSDVNQFRVSLSDTAQTLIEEEINDYIYYIKIDSGQSIRNFPKAGGSGLTGRYYHNSGLSGAHITKIDPEINFSWEWNPPFSGMSKDFSVRWVGRLEVPESGQLPFYVYSDDGVRLYIDNKLVIDNWNDKRASWSEGKIHLESGFHEIMLEYYDAGYDADVKLAWRDKTTIIPTFYLYPEE